MERIFNTIDSLLNRSENRFGKVLIALIIGCFLLFLAGLISAVRFETFYHGNGFTRLSLHPFEMKGENDLRFRILSPLIGFLLFMRGPLFKYFMLFVLYQSGLQNFYLKKSNLYLNSDKQ